MQKPIFQQKRLRELAESKAGEGGGLTNNGRSHAMASRTPSPHIVERLAITSLAAGQSRRGMDANSIGIQDHPTRITPQSATKSMLPKLGREKSSLEGSTNGEILYSAQDVQTWLLNLGATFYVTPNYKWFSNYSVGAGGIVQLDNGHEYRIAEIGEIPIRLPNGPC